MSRKILGLDIKSDSVAAVLVDSSMKGSQIEAHGFASIQDDVTPDEGISAAITAALENIDLLGTSCVVSFPSGRVSFRNVQVPFKDAKKIRRVLPFEIESTLPFAVDDLIIDFSMLKLSIPVEEENSVQKADEDSPDQTDLLTASVEKNDLRSHLDIFETFKIDPEIVTIAGYATALCLTKTSGFPENWILIDNEKGKATLYISFQGQIFLVRSFPSHPEMPDGIENLCNNIEQTILASYGVLPVEFQPECAFITGNIPEDAGLCEKISQSLGISVTPLNLAKSKNIPVPDSRWQPDMLNNALALALNEAEGRVGFNFRRDEFALRRQWIEHKASFIKTGVLAGVVMILALFNIAFDSISLGKRLNDLDRQIETVFKTTFPEVKRVVDPVKQMTAKVDEVKKVSLFSQDNQKKVRAIDALQNINSRIPKEIDVKFLRLVMRPEDILISGNTDTNSSVDSIKSGLEKSEIFKTITISSTSRDKKENRVRFKLKVEL